MRKAILFSVLCAAVFGAWGCASRRPVEDKPPTVRVTRLESTLFTPRLVKFQAAIVIRNNSARDLDVGRVDWAVDLQGKELFNETFDGAKRTRRRGSQTVTFTFQIAMGDILDEAAAILAAGAVEVTLRGTVRPGTTAAFSPIPFVETVSIPIPRMPLVAFEGSDVAPVGGAFTVRIRVKNTNDFPLTVASVDSYIEINRVRYELLQSERDVAIPPGEWRTVALRMENIPGKALSAVLNTLLTPKSEFDVGGTIECKSPYGWIVVPIDVKREKG